MNETHAQMAEISSVRALYCEAAENESTCRKLQSILNVYNEQYNLVGGYKAATMMVMAKYYLNPISKLSSFNTGKDLLEKAIDAEPLSVELRFLRFSIQSSCPKFLRYSHAVESDKIYILNAYKNLNDENLKSMIKVFMDKRVRLTGSEKEILLSRVYQNGAVDFSIFASLENRN